MNHPPPYHSKYRLKSISYSQNYFNVFVVFIWYNYRQIYTHTHFSTHTGSKAKGRRGSLALPISSIWNTGERRAEHEWNKVEQRGKARENVRGERSGPDKAGPRQGYAGAAVSRSAWNPAPTRSVGVARFLSGTGAPRAAMQIRWAAGLKVVEEPASGGSRDGQGTSGKLSHLRVVRTPSAACSNEEGGLRGWLAEVEAVKSGIIFETVQLFLLLFRRINIHQVFPDCWSNVYASGKWIQGDDEWWWSFKIIFQGKEICLKKRKNFWTFKWNKISPTKFSNYRSNLITVFVSNSLHQPK